MVTIIQTSQVSLHREIFQRLMSEKQMTALSQYLGREKPFRIKINQSIFRTINRLCFEYISKEYTLFSLPHGVFEWATEVVGNFQLSNCAKLTLFWS